MSGDDEQLKRENAFVTRDLELKQELQASHDRIQARASTAQMPDGSFVQEPPLPTQRPPPKPFTSNELRSDHQFLSIWPPRPQQTPKPGEKAPKREPPTVVLGKNVTCKFCGIPSEVINCCPGRPHSFSASTNRQTVAQWRDAHKGEGVPQVKVEGFFPLGGYFPNTTHQFPREVTGQSEEGWWQFADLPCTACGQKPSELSCCEVPEVDFTTFGQKMKTERRERDVNVAAASATSSVLIVTPNVDGVDENKKN